MYGESFTDQVRPHGLDHHHGVAIVSETHTSLKQRVPVGLEQTAAALEALPTAVLLLSSSGVVRHANLAAELRFGCAREEMVGRDFFRETLPELERAGVGEQYRADIRQGAVALDLRERGGGSAALRVSIRSYEDAVGRWGLVMVEDESALATEVARRQLAERLAAVGELAAGAAHEINNPLASIKGFAQLLARDTLDRGQQQALEIISQECTRVAEIVDNLLEFATQQRVREHELIDLSVLTSAVLGLKRYSLETSGVEVETELDGGLSLVEAEKGALQRLLLILINESERSLQRRESDRRLTVRARESNTGVVVYVSDNGPGVPRHELPTVLDGPGDSDVWLGLSSAEQIARDHGGTLWVESGEGRGTSFTLRLPRSTRRRIEPVDSPPRPPTPAEDAGRLVRVLIADDEPTLRLALSMFLVRHGFEVEQAEDAAQALEMANCGTFDFALIDFRMPGDGITLLQRLDACPDWTGTGILMTGDHTQDRVRDEIRRGRPHLTKPFDMMAAVRLMESLGRTAVGQS